MKTVSIHELKRSLAKFIDEAASGSVIVITRRGKPVAALGAPNLEHLHAGALVGRGSVEPGPRIRGCEDFLAVLADDRGGGPDR